MRLLGFLSLSCAIALFVSCVGVAEGDRQLVDQINRASEVILVNDLFGPRQAQAVMDIKKNSEVLLKNLGEPKNPQPYSPEASEAARKKATESHQTPWWTMLFTAISGLGVGGALVRGLVTVFPTLFAGPVGVALKSMVDGITAVRQQADSIPDKKVHIDEVLAKLKIAQESDGTREYIRTCAKESEERLKTPS